MFTNLSLLKDGAFMMCESVAEFDPNMPDPNTPEVLEQVKRELAPQVETYDPVNKLIRKMRPLYERVIAAGQINLEPESAEVAMGDLETVSTLASDVADAVRTCLTKMMAIYKLTADSEGNRWIYEEFNNNLGFFMKNRKAIKSDGRDTFHYEADMMELFDQYDAMRVLHLRATAYPNLPDYPISLNDFMVANPYMGDSGVLDRFESVTDIFNCILLDDERRIRIENSAIVNSNLDELFYNATSHNDCVHVRGERDSMAHLIRYISKYLRQIKICAYELQCGVMDHQDTVQIAEYHKCMRSMISGTMDMFYIPMFFMLHLAYRLRRSIACRNAVTNYVTQVKDIFK